MKDKAIIHQAEEGGYWAEVLTIPGCLTYSSFVIPAKAGVHSFFLLPLEGGGLRWG